MEIQILNTNITMDSRKIADLTGKSHSHVCRDFRKQLEAQEIGESKYGSSYKTTQGKEAICFKLDYEQLMILLTGYSIELRAKVIKHWNTLVKLQQHSVPQSFPEALKLAYEQSLVIEQQKAQLLENKPKVEFYEAVTESTDAIDMGSVAKVINMGIGRNQLFKFLREHKVLMRNNIPYQEFVDKGYFRVIESRFNKPTGDVGINLKTIVYQKGVDFILDLVTEKYVY